MLMEKQSVHRMRGIGRGRIAVCGLLVAASALILLLGVSSQPVLAVHHIAEISEVMSGFDGDPSVQFVEIDRLTAYQNSVTNTRLTAFNPDGTLAGVLLDPVGGNVGLLPGKWIMGTTAFEAAAGISADFTFSPGILPAAGMVCWGGPGLSAPAPGTWDASDPNNYVDCVSYGGASFTGTNPMSPNPNSAGAGNGKLSLTRSVTSTAKTTNPWRNSDDATDFKLATPSPTNDAGQVGSLDAPPHTPTPTPTPCGGPCPTPTDMATSTNTPTPTDTPTTTPTAAETPCPSGGCPVGGIALNSDLRSLPLETANSSIGFSTLAWSIVAVAAAAVLVGATWYARKLSTS